MADLIAHIARRGQRIRVECCNPDCGRARDYGPATVARWATVHPIDILEFRIRARCPAGCGARAGVRVQSPSTEGKRRVRMTWVDDPHVWTRGGF